MSQEENENETDFATKCEILADLWMAYKDDTEEDLESLFSYGDLGFPLAYCITNDIVEVTDKARKFVEEIFDLYLSSYGLEDEGFADLEEVEEAIKDHGYLGEDFEDED
jgi:hypothetical protein